MKTKYIIIFIALLLICQNYSPWAVIYAQDVDVIEEETLILGIDLEVVRGASNTYGFDLVFDTTYFNYIGFDDAITSIAEVKTDSPGRLIVVMSATSDDVKIVQDTTLIELMFYVKQIDALEIETSFVFENLFIGLSGREIISNAENGACKIEMAHQAIIRIRKVVP